MTITYEKFKQIVEEAYQEGFTDREYATSTSAEEYEYSNVRDVVAEYADVV